MAFVVPTRVGPSAIEGIGAFAVQDISKGTIVWRFDPVIDRLYDPAALDTMHPVIRDFLMRYAYLHAKTGKYVLCCDNSRFVNHADDPNTQGEFPPGEHPEGVDRAVRDIRAGEEITCDYRTFDEDVALKLGG